jgi:hypothetical protein
MTDECSFTYFHVPFGGAACARRTTLDGLALLACSMHRRTRKWSTARNTCSLFVTAFHELAVYRVKGGQGIQEYLGTRVPCLVARHIHLYSSAHL